MCCGDGMTGTWSRALAAAAQQTAAAVGRRPQPCERPCSAQVMVVFTRGLPPLRLLVVLPITFFMGFGFIRQGHARLVDPMRPPVELLPE